MFTVFASLSRKRKGYLADKPDDPDKGLQPLSERSEGEKKILVLKDYLPSYVLDPEESEEE